MVGVQSDDPEGPSQPKAFSDSVELTSTCPASWLHACPTSWALGCQGDALKCVALLGFQCQNEEDGWLQHQKCNSNKN